MKSFIWDFRFPVWRIFLRFICKTIKLSFSVNVIRQRQMHNSFFLNRFNTLTLLLFLPPQISLDPSAAAWRELEHNILVSALSLNGAQYLTLSKTGPSQIYRDPFFKKGKLKGPNFNHFCFQITINRFHKRDRNKQTKKRIVHFTLFKLDSYFTDERVSFGGSFGQDYSAAMQEARVRSRGRRSSG